MGMILSGFVFSVIVTLIVLSIVYKDDLKAFVTGNSSYSNCAVENGDVIVSANKMLQCPDPGEMCGSIKINMENTLNVVKDSGALIKSRRLNKCEDEYCPLYYQYLQCKCKQCINNTGSELWCSNECFWDQQTVCTNLVNCTLIVN